MSPLSTCGKEGLSSATRIFSPSARRGSMLSPATWKERSGKKAAPETSTNAIRALWTYRFAAGPFSKRCMRLQDDTQRAAPLPRFFRSGRGADDRVVRVAAGLLGGGVPQLEDRFVSGRVLDAQAQALGLGSRRQL